MLSVLTGNARLKVLPANSNFTNPLNVAHGGTGLVKIGDGELYVPTAASAMDLLARSTHTQRLLAKAAAETSPSWYDFPNVLGPYYLFAPGSRPLAGPRVVHFSASARGALTNNNPLGGNALVLISTATASDATDATGAWIRATTGNVSGNQGGFLVDTTGTGTNGQLQYEEECLLVVKFRTGSDITSVRITVGLGPNSPFNTETPSSRHIGIRYSTVSSDAHWIAWVGDGTANGNSTVDTGVTVNASTVYTLTIRVYATSTLSYSADIDINGTTTTFSIPGASLFNTGPRAFVGVITQAAATRAIDLSRLVLVQRHTEQLI